MDRFFVGVKGDPEFKDVSEKDNVTVRFPDPSEHVEKPVRGSGGVHNMRIRNKNDFSGSFHAAI